MVNINPDQLYQAWKEDHENDPDPDTWYEWEVQERIARTVENAKKWNDALQPVVDAWLKDRSVLDYVYDGVSLKDFMLYGYPRSHGRPDVISVGFWDAISVLARYERKKENMAGWRDLIAEMKAHDEKVKLHYGQGGEKR